MSQGDVVLDKVQFSLSYTGLTHMKLVLVIHLRKHLYIADTLDLHIAIPHVHP